MRFEDLSDHDKNEIERFTRCLEIVLRFKEEGLLTPEAEIKAYKEVYENSGSE